ncbi:MAG: uroporphyrinogen decarboxylase family protein, partial [Spirochaetota bacterium]
VCLMGNLKPIELFLNGTPEHVVEEARHCIEIADSKDGGYILAPGGAFIPGTPDKNIQAIFSAIPKSTSG